MLSFILFIALLFIPATHLNAGTNQDARDIPAIPFERGEVVFSSNERSPNQIYIIGMSHRDTLTRASARGTDAIPGIGKAVPITTVNSGPPWPSHRNSSA